MSKKQKIINEKALCEVLTEKLIWNIDFILRDHDTFLIDDPYRRKKVCINSIANLLLYFILNHSDCPEKSLKEFQEFCETRLKIYRNQEIG